MNAVGIILAAGHGRRLQPYTLQKPKPILSAYGTTCLDSILDSMKDSGISDVYIVLNYLSDKIKDHLSARSRDFNFFYCFQEKLNGNLGAVEIAVNRIFLDQNNTYDCCVISAADYFIPRSLITTMVVAFRTDMPSAVVAARNIPIKKVPNSSEIIFSQNGKILKFIEKPRKSSNEYPLSAALIYVVELASMSKFKTDLEYVGEQNCLDIMNKILSNKGTISLVKSDEVIDLTLSDLA